MRDGDGFSVPGATTSAAPFAYEPPEPQAKIATLPKLHESSERIARAIQLVVCVVLVAVWSGVGFIFWIPFLVRSIATYTTAVLSATFTGAPLFSAQIGLDTAVRFWFAGFQVVLEARHDVNSPRRAERLENTPPIKNLFELLFHHVLLTLLFWMAVVALWLAPWKGLS